MFKQSRTAQLLGIAALASVLACASERERRQQPRSGQSEYDGEALESGELSRSERSLARGNPPMVVTPELSVTESDPPQWRITAVVVDVGVAETCRIEAARANFDYDSAELSADARATLAAIADCFIGGPLAGRNLVVLGHADPRGPDEYNRELGMSRAQAVAEALAREGLATTRIDVESHGEAHAHADPDEWPDDRRVDIRVAD